MHDGSRLYSNDNSLGKRLYIYLDIECLVMDVRIQLKTRKPPNKAVVNIRSFMLLVICVSRRV